MSGYYLLKNGEYAYNKSYSVGYDFGSIKRLDRYPMGALSTLYICFALKRHDSDFIKAYFDSLKWYREIYMISAEGARNHGLLNVPTEDFFDTKHYLPENVDEQRKIADFLIALDRRIEAQQSLVDNLKKYKRGLLRNVFDKSIKTANYQKIYWTEAKLGEICTYRRGSFPQPYGLSVWYDEKNGMPFIQVADVNDNMTINSDTNRHISDMAKSRSVFIPKGTLIVTLQGTIGRVAITSYDAYIDRTLLIIQNISDCVLKEFLMYAIYMKFDIEKQTADGSIIKTITKETFTEFTIHIPPIYEQQKIVNLLRSLDQRMGTSKEVLEKLGKMRSSLLQQLFI
jgi:type I restriction enzyme S subunit